MKRRRESGGSVTGGTGDIKPQIMTIYTGLNSANNYITASFVVPVIRPQGNRNKPVIMEILWIDWYLGIEDDGDDNTFRGTSSGIYSLMY